MDAASLEDLIVWQLATSLRQRVIRFTGRRPVQEDVRFCAQIRSSAASVAVNIAEGFGRCHRAEFIQFLRYARGSAFETREWLRDAHDRGYLSGEEFVELYQLSDESIATLTGLILRLQRKR